MDRWYDTWSRHLIIEVDRERHDDLGSSRPIAEQILHASNVGAETIAWSAWRELQDADSMTPLALEGLVLQLFARLRRRTGNDPASRPAPPWLDTALEFVHDNYRLPIRLSALADVSGVHPDHFARVFGAAHGGVTVGEYVRRLRVEAAAASLATTNEAISTIAYRVGFSDQSHLTRVFKRLMGVTPGRYRALHRDSA